MVHDPYYILVARQRNNGTEQNITAKINHDYLNDENPYSISIIEVHSS